MEVQPRAGKWSDRTGVFLSGLCILHCLLIPVLAPLFPTLTLLGEGNHFHELLFIPLLLVAGFAFWRGYLFHKVRIAAVLGGVGITLLVVSFFALGPDHSAIGSLIFSALGSVFLIGAHLWNMRLCRCHHSCFPSETKL